MTKYAAKPVAATRPHMAPTRSMVAAPNTFNTRTNPAIATVAPINVSGLGR